MGLLGRIVGGIVRPQPEVADRAALADFLDSRASFLCQKCVVEFCRVMAGVYWQKLFSESAFLEELDRSRWRSYAPAFAMVAEMAEAAIRPHAGLGQRRLPDALTALARDVFARYPLPEGAPEDFWEEGLAYVRERLDATQAGAPRAVKDMTKPSARRIFDVLPLHPQIVTNDFDYIRNNLRMNLLRIHEDFIAAARLDLVAASLLDAREQA